jgi:hypothetical protein
MRIARIDKITGEVVNIEIWNTMPTETGIHRFTDDVKLEKNMIVDEDNHIVTDPNITIVTDEIDYSRVAILDRLYNSCSQEEILQLAGILDKKASFIVALDNKNWDLARYKVNESKDESLITEEMAIKIIGFLP